MIIVVYWQKVFLYGERDRLKNPEHKLILVSNLNFPKIKVPYIWLIKDFKENIVAL
jgi:hypothetical protein